MAPGNTSFHQASLGGALLAPLRFAFIAVLIVALCTVAAWVVDGLWVFKVWPDGVGRLKLILAADLERASTLARWQGLPPDVVAGSANLLYAAVFQFTGVHDMGVRFAERAPLSIPDTIVRDSYIGNRDAIEVAMIGTQLLGVRLATFLLVTPMVLLLYVLATADGLTQRALRRACGGRESAGIYHRAKHLQLVFLVSTGTLHLLLPASIDPRLLWWPAASASALLVRTQCAFYKKHL